MPVAGFIERVVDVPDGVQVQIEGGHVVVKGPRHALRRTLSHPRIRMQVDGKQVKIRSEYPRRKDGALVGTFAPSFLRGYSERILTCFPSTCIRIRGWDRVRRRACRGPFTTTWPPSIWTWTPTGTATTRSMKPATGIEAPQYT